MGNKNVRRIKIQYPDGKYHDIEVRNFFGVKLDGEEKLILEYCDFTDNNSDSFAVIVRENGHFVKKPLNDSAAYTNLYRRIVWRRKRPYDLELLPERVDLCAEALTHIEIGEDLTSLKKTDQGVVEKPERVRESRHNVATRRQLIVYVDVAPDYDPFPYYIDTNISAQVGEGKKEAYHHLTPLELEDLEMKYDIVFEQRELNLLPQKPYKFNPMNSRTIREFTLSSSEKEIIEELYRKLPDFTNYYEFFGIEDMRGMSYDEIFNSERMRVISRVIKQGARDGDVVSLGLFEFLEGFKEEFNKKMILK